MENIQSQPREAIVLVEYRDAMNACERGIKRLIDIFAAFLGLIILSPLFLIIFCILLLAGGSVIFKQERIGYKGNKFFIYKFRTMCLDAEKNGIPRTESERREKITRVGKFLRDYHLDELPQIFNVLNGDMSLVGPRPERKIFIDQIMQINPNYVHIYKMRPGLTSKATLYNGYTDTMEKMLVRLDMDLEYLSTRSLWGDFKIVCKTGLAIFSGKKF